MQLAGSLSQDTTYVAGRVADRRRRPLPTIACCALQCAVIASVAGPRARQQKGLTGLVSPFHTWRAGCELRDVLQVVPRTAAADHLDPWLSIESNQAAPETGPGARQRRIVDPPVSGRIIGDVGPENLSGSVSIPRECHRSDIASRHSTTWLHHSGIDRDPS